MSEVIVQSTTNLQNRVQYGDGRELTIDEPVGLGGDGAGPDPYTLLLAALGGCISMTVTLYARRKGWPLERVTVRLRQQRIHARDCTECARSTEGFVHRIERLVTVEGDLTDEQRERLQEIAHKCPVHKTLISEIVVADMEELTMV
ncbi:MAG TPA: OsmC family protein [Pyrinomonadaceae bacterium]|jgi:putative redox protein|nr:OsmC family protein [Pyrinomonadaceae bacterium]